MLRRIGWVLLTAASLVGCATAPESLRNSASGQKIHLTEAISTVEFRGLNVRCEEGALPGIYSAEKEDDAGVYFYGPGRSIWNTNAVVQPTPRLLVGGIYVPRDSSKSPQFFFFFETDVYTVASIDKVVQDRIVTGTAMPATTGGVGVGPTVAGNVLGGALISAMIQADVGKISRFPPIQDRVVVQKIRDSTRTP